MFPIDLSFEELKDLDFEMLWIKLPASILIFGTCSSTVCFASD